MSRAPLVAVLSTGDEVIDPLGAAVAAPGSASIFDANRPALLAAASLERATTVDLGVAADNAAALEAALERALGAGADVLVCSGGVSMGDRDLVK